MVPDDVSIVADDDSRVPEDVGAGGVSFEDGTDDHHVGLLGMTPAEKNGGPAFDFLSEFCPVLLSGAKDERHRPRFLQTDHIDFCLRCTRKHLLHSIENRLGTFLQV